MVSKPNEKYFWESLSCEKEKFRKKIGKKPFVICQNKL